MAWVVWVDGWMDAFNPGALRHQPGPQNSIKLQVMKDAHHRMVPIEQRANSECIAATYTTIGNAYVSSAPGGGQGGVQITQKEMDILIDSRAKALSSYEKAREWFPTHAQANCNIGVLLYQSGRMDEAEAQLRHTVQIQPMFLECRRTYAAVLEASGRAAEARRLMEEGQRIGALGRF
mmetsp:Transcript_6764/g.17223  ORF Transcript_6764/g.17223 Transcript_6764/m.17223 type:complete len:178 (+) Transcript_6764:97-630(+)